MDLSWKLNPCDHDRNTNPYMAPWYDLEEEIKEYAQDAVRGIPEILAMDEFEICRLKE